MGAAVTNTVDAVNIHNDAVDTRTFMTTFAR
jgi:hypothetical protein